MIRKLNGRNIVGALVMFTALLVTVSVSPAKSLPSQEARQANVHQLANRVCKVIKLIEDNPTIPCEMRNHLVKRFRMLDDALESGRRSAG